MARVNLYLSEETLGRLRRFLMKRYGKRRLMSLAVELALKEYLDRHAGDDEGGVK